MKKISTICSSEGEREREQDCGESEETRETDSKRKKAEHKKPQ